MTRSTRFLFDKRDRFICSGLNVCVLVLILSACVALAGGGSTLSSSRSGSFVPQVAAAPTSRLSITPTTCPGGTQGAAYAGCTIVASGTPPYTYSVSAKASLAPLPEGMSLNAGTGVISSALIGGQGTYTPKFVVTDAASTQATRSISIALNGSNAFLATIFPST